MKTLDDKVKKKDDEINELKEENNLLKTSLENLQKLFDKLIKFLKDRMLNKKKINIMTFQLTYILMEL